MRMYVCVLQLSLDLQAGCWWQYAGLGSQWARPPALHMDDDRFLTTHCRPLYHWPLERRHKCVWSVLDLIPHKKKLSLCRFLNAGILFVPVSKCTHECVCGTCTHSCCIEEYQKPGETSQRTHSCSHINHICSHHEIRQLYCYTTARCKQVCCRGDKRRRRRWKPAYLCACRWSDFLHNKKIKAGRLVPAAAPQE